jgi:glycosyltransferase involved in cell wall biosynthesis
MDILARFGISCELYPYFLNKDKNDYFVNLSIDKKSPIVCAGVADFRKGVHRFIEIAASLPNEKFVWVGSTSHISIANNKVSFVADNFRTIDYEIGQRIANRRITLEIPKNVEFMGLVKDPNTMRQIFSNAKCLLMLSTDDPFPLVVIEAKLLNKNVVNLKESGDSYTVCDSADLILEKYDRTPIINYLKGLSPNPVKFNEELYNKLQSNSKINRNVYLSLIEAN